MTTVTPVLWGSIELLHNIVTTLTHLKEDGNVPLPRVTYRAKVKLHGANCAVQVLPDQMVCQSRTTILTPKDDFKGFARWAHGHEAYFRGLPTGLVVYGEWAGPGVEAGMAVSGLSAKIFAVFAVRRGLEDTAPMVTEPVEISAILGVLPAGMYVLPWQGEQLCVDFGDRASLDAVALEANARVEAVEQEDPWVKATFGISGLGEGLVFYAVEAPEHPANLMWKAKGAKHRTAGTKTAVQVAPTVVAGISDFVQLMVTDARLDQGLSTCGGQKDKRMTPKFLAWVTADVQKESAAELAASGLTWPQVEKAVTARAREWFLG